MRIKVILVDINPKMIRAWRDTFENEEDVEVVHGSMIDQAVSAWVSPTNSQGNMDGGLDKVIKDHLGGGIEKALKKRIAERYQGRLPVGHAICTPTERPQPRYVISTPTMVGSSEDVSDTMNVALACAAAFQAVNMQNDGEPGTIRSVAIPGLGANTGKVPVEICADLMWTGYSLFRENEYRTFEALHIALAQQLGTLAPMSGQTSKASQQSGIPAEELLGEDEEDIDMEDFDDFD